MAHRGSGSRFVKVGFVIPAFFMSGVAGLSLEILWLRQLSLFFGATAHATAVLLAAFMGGLALGGVLGGRLADRAGSRPLTAYGLCEIGTGLMAVGVPALFESADGLLRFVDAAGASPLLARFLLALLILLPPTVLMGATLPLVSRWLSLVGGSLPRGTGLLYAVNTAGALLGTLACAAWLIPRLGIFGSSLLVLAIDGSIGVLALLLSRETVQVSPTEAADRSRLPAVLLFLAGLTGFIGLSLEVIGTRVLSLFAGTTVYAFAAVLAVFLFGISLGSWLVLPLLKRSPSFCMRTVGVLQLLTALTLLASVPLVNKLPYLYLRLIPLLPGGRPHPLLLGLAVSPMLLLLPAALGGACFPLLVRASGREGHGGGRAVGGLYAGNTIGAVVGSIVAGFVLIPWLGLRQSLLAVAVVASGLAVSGSALFLAPGWMARGEGRRAQTLRRRLAGALPALLPLAVLPFVPAWDPALLSSGVYWQSEGFLATDTAGEVRPVVDTLLYERRPLFHSEGLGATVDVFEKANGQRSLAINGKTVASTDLLDMRLQMMMGSLGVLLHPDPKEVLIIGLGTGMTSGSAAAHPGVRALTVAELTPGVVAAAKLFGRWNGDLHRDPKLRMRVTDGANFVRHTDETFDVISSDPIHPFSAGSGTLYSVEHFRQCRERLRSGGMFLQWLPLYQLSPRDFLTVIRTFTEVFPHTTLWFTGTDSVLLGSEEPLAIDRRQVEAMRAALATPRMSRLLAPVGFDRPERLLATLLATESELVPLSESAPHNTIDRPFLEYSAPLAISQHGIRRNLEMLMARREHAIELLLGGLSLSPYLESSTIVHETLLGTNRAGGVEALRNALRLDPDDAFVQHLYAKRLASLPPEAVSPETFLDARPMARRFAAWAPMPEFWISASRSLMHHGEGQRALEILDEAAGVLPASTLILSQKALCLIQMDRPEEAWRLLESLASHPSRPAHPHHSTLLARFLAAELTGRTDESRSLLPTLERVCPISTNPHQLLASFLMRRGDNETARQALLRGIDFRPGDPLPRVTLARMEMAAGNPGGAAEVLDGGLKLSPRSPPLLQMRGQVFLLAGDPARAAKYLTAALRQDPGSIDTWLQLASAYRQLGDGARARWAMESATRARAARNLAAQERSSPPTGRRD